MEKIRFIFSTPEGFGNQIKSILESQGFIINNNCNPPLWRSFDFLNSLETKSFANIGPTILKNILFKNADDIYKWGTLDIKMGSNFGLGFKMWVFLKIACPDAKFVFSYRNNLEKNLAALLANNKNWIPSWGSCPNKCEQQLKNQIVQMGPFSEFYPESCILIKQEEDLMLLNE